MKIKTSELIAPALDWAVAKCEGASEWLLLVEYEELYQCGKLNKYSTDWACGGPIMEREGLRWNKYGDQFYVWTPDHPWYDPLHEPMWAEMEGVKWRWFVYGHTLLIAAMRCYVASKLGDEIDVPDALFSSYGSNVEKG